MSSTTRVVDDTVLNKTDIRQGGMPLLSQRAASWRFRHYSEEGGIANLRNASENLRSVLEGITSHEVRALVERATENNPLYRLYGRDSKKPDANHTYRTKIAHIPDIGWHSGACREFDAIATTWLESVTREGFEDVPLEVKREYTGLYLYWTA